MKSCFAAVAVILAFLTAAFDGPACRSAEQSAAGKAPSPPPDEEIIRQPGLFANFYFTGEVALAGPASRQGRVAADSSWLNARQLIPLAVGPVASENSLADEPIRV